MRPSEVLNIVVEDTLSTLLNPATIRPGSSSHPYHFELSDEGLLRFTFNNIMLPDSNVNEPASHGFVKFRVLQLPDLSDGSLIENTAAIYFDFNEAIWTNTTFHEVQRNFLPVSTQEIFVPNVDVAIYPNPFSGSTTFSVTGKEYKAIELRVFDALGRLVAAEYHNTPYFEFSAKQNAKGIHFYQLLSEGQLISTGKLVLK